MATPSEQDPVVEEDIKSIVIKLPFDLQERLLAFPFLHAIRDRYPEAKLHFITPKINIEVLNLLPFKAYYHEFDEDEIKSILDVYRYCVLAKIYDVDLFISLTNSFPDACLGLGFKAKQRLGFSDGWKSLVLNQKTTRPVGHHICEDFFALYKVHLGQEVNARMRVMSRDLSSIIPDWDEKPYFAVNLSPVRGAYIEEEWLDLLSSFEGQRIVLFASEDQDKVQVHVENFLAKLPKKNTYVNFIYPSMIELARMMAFARGVITYNGPAATLSAYSGSRSLVLFDREDPSRYGPFYFLADTLVVNPEAGTSKEVLKPRSAFNMEEVAIKAFEFFRLTTASAQ
jgi:ADP-heptose:LPS heptosyltransferase